MVCTTHALGTLSGYKYVAIVSRHKGQWLLSRHCQRETWETQGGHIEAGESPQEAARRELFEECGAVEYEMRPLCDYAAEGTTGVAYVAEIARLAPLPKSEMAEVRCFEVLPPNLTYPAITPKLVALAQAVPAEN